MIANPYWRPLAVAVAAAMAQNYNSRPVTEIQTRSSSRVAAGVQPVTAIRDKFEKPPGHIWKSKNFREELENDSFADIAMAPLLLDFEPPAKSNPCLLLLLYHQDGI